MKHNSSKINKADWDAVDSLPLSDETLSSMKPVKEKHSEIPKRGWGLQKEPVKISVSIRLNPDIVEYFKSQGKGWHSKINSVLCE